MAAYDAEQGAFSDDELAEADRLLDAAGVVDLTVATPKPRKRAAPKKASRSRASA
jgi:hypothetical protein